MNHNYNSLLGQMMLGKKARSKDATHAVPIRQSALTSVQLFFAASVFSLFGAANAFAQTTIINPAAEGGFNSGSTFAANGWTVANEGTSPIKWAVGTAASGTTAVGATTVGSATVALTAANANIAVGQIVYGSGIPSNTFVQAISGTSLTLSQVATADGAATTLGFGKYSGGISVATTQLTTTAVVKPSSYSLTLSAANPNISVGMLISPIANFIGADTYVASINGTTLGLSKATLNVADQAIAQTLSFTATASAISGNAAYVTNDNGASYSYGGYGANRTVYFYRDITNVPLAEKAMTLTFDVKSDPSSGAGWQVWVAPISQAVTGTDTQVTLPFTYGVVWPGATLISFNSNPQIAATKTTAFIPKSFAGAPFRLIFVWTNGTTAGTLAPAAIDNISLTSRMPEEITCAHSGLWSQPDTWDGGKVPTPADIVVFDHENESVMIDSRYSGCDDLFLGAANTLVQYAPSSVMDEFNVYNDLTINASGARFNNHDATNGKYLKVGHDITVAANARLDSSIGGQDASKGRLMLNGSTVQTVKVDPAGFVGGSAAGTNAFGNLSGVLNNLEVNNTSPATPNVKWDANGVRINYGLILTNARVSITPGKRLILGNFGSLNSTNFICPSGNGFIGTVSKWISSSNTRDVLPNTEYPGTDNSYKSFWYPFINSTGLDRSLYLLPDANPATAGEVAVTYTDATNVTKNLTIADDSYTINKRYEGNWAFSTPDGTSTATPLVYAPNATTPTNRVAVYANGAYEALDGSSRLMNASAALPGTHQDGTAQPFVFRKGLPFAALTANPIFVGINDASALNTNTAVTSVASGDWNNPSTWGGTVPSSSSCANVVIGAGHTVTVTTAASAANVTIMPTATLINNGGATTMTVGCTNNNAAFYNYGTHTMTTGNLKVNGFVAHKGGSFFNQTGGEIIIDSNDNGNAATSVAYGGVSCKIETANLALTGGKITIVDPLVNLSAPVASATSIGNYTLNTAGTGGTYRVPTAAAITTNSVSLTGQYNTFYVGQIVTGHANIPANTKISAVSTGMIGFPPAITLTLSNNVTAAIPAPATQAGATTTGSATVTLAAANANIAVGQEVTGTGIPANTTVESISGTTLVLSQAATATGASVTLSFRTYLNFSSMVNGSSSVVLEGSVNNPNLSVGQIVSGTGIQTGTKIVGLGTSAGSSPATELRRIDLSLPVKDLPTSPITSPQTLAFSAVSEGANSTILTAPNTNIKVGMIVKGTGIKPGTYVTADVSGTAVSFSEPIQAGAPTPLVLEFYQANTLSSGSFIYSSSSNYAAGLNHTLQIGDGVSTQNTSTITNGFNCQFQATGQGLFSLGNLTVNAPDGNNRFMTATAHGLNNNYYINVQNALTITSGSTLKRTLTNVNMYVGGNIVNDGLLNTTTNGALYLGNRLNGVDVPSTIAQTISGSGTFLANQPGGSTFPGYSVSGLTINNTSSAGVTISVPNFRTNTVILTNGIVHTSAATPLYCGVPDVMNATYFSGSFTYSSFPASGPSGTTGSTPTFIDGPCVYANRFDATASAFKLFPVGKNGKYLPIAIASSGGVELMAEAFDTNTGTVNGTNASGLSSTRWKVTRVGAAGNFTGYNVKLGSTPDVTAANTIVQAIADQGSYDVVSSPASTITFSTSDSSLSNKPSITLATAQTGDFSGNFAYASGPACTGTPDPGATIASAASACGGQSVTLSLANPTAGTNVAYQWQSSLNNGTTWTDIAGATAATYVAIPSADTSYRANVTCSGNTGVSTLVKVTTTPSAATTTGASICTAGTANLTAAGSQILNWYDAQTGGNLVATGTSYSPTVSQTTTYYVASGSVSVGTPVNTAAYAGTSVSSSLFSGIAFDAVNNLNLKTVTVYPKNTALLTPITVGLFNAAGNIVSGTAPVTFIPTANTAAVGTVPQVVTLNYIVPVGTGYRLVVTNGLVATNNTLGNSTAAIAYPTTGGAIKLTGNVSSLNGTISTTANTTSVFHNLTFDEICESVRVPVTATVANTPAPTGAATQDSCTTGTIADFSVTGAAGATFTWYNAPTLGTAIPTTTVAVLNTTYYVSQTVNGCEGPRLAVKASGPCLGNDDFKIAELKFYPNPVYDQLTITAKDVITRVELYNLLGQQLNAIEANSDNIQINLSMYAQSTYLIKVYSENKVQFFKVIKK